MKISSILYLFNSWSLRVGEFNLTIQRGQSLQIVKTFIHPKYDNNTAYYDVGILQTKIVQVSDFVHPICLPQEVSGDEDKYSRYAADLIGD